MDEKKPTFTKRPVSNFWQEKYIGRMDTDIVELKSEVRQLKDELKQSETRISSKIEKLADKMDSNLKWIIGIQVDTMAAVITALLKLKPEVIPMDVIELKSEVRQIREDMKQAESRIYAKLDANFKWTLGIMITMFSWILFALLKR